MSVLSIVVWFAVGYVVGASVLIVARLLKTQGVAVVKGPYRITLRPPAGDLTPDQARAWAHGVLGAASAVEEGTR